MKKLIFPLLMSSLLFLVGCGDSVITDTCLVCHSDQMKADVTLQFNQSVHKAGQIAVDYAGGRASCAQCHSSEGFIEYATTGEVQENITAPSAWECNTCHNIHKTFEPEDYALRLDAAVVMNVDATVSFDNGNSNLCANCHQARTAEPNVAKPGTDFEIASTHYGPHHGPQANVVLGIGFAEIAGSMSYPAAGSNNHIEPGCVGCHMGEYADGMGGHTWNPSLIACNDCHGAAEEDYNYGGVQDEIATLLEEVRDALVAAGVVEYVDADDAYEPVVGTYPMVQAQAYYNWVGLEEDRSLGAHNPKYVKALLTNTLEAL